MRPLIICAFWFFTFASVSLADDSAEPQRIQRAYERLHSKPPTTQTVKQATTQSKVAGEPATQPNQKIPAIDGVWQQSSRGLVKIAQDGGKWTAECEYLDANNVQFKWEIKDGTITADGKLHCKVHFTQATKGWKMWQVRDASVAQDGLSIAGFSKWDGGREKFTWTKQPKALPLPKIGDSREMLESYVKSVPNRHLRVISESSEEQIIELNVYTPGSIGIAGIPNSAQDPATYLVARYTISGGKITQIDRP